MPKQPMLPSRVRSALVKVSGCAGTLAVALTISSAHADPEKRWSVHLEGGIGSMVSGFQRDSLDYGLGYQGHLRPAWNATDAFAIELSLGSWFFPSDSGTGRASLFGAGVRVEPRLGTRWRWFLDGHGGLGLTGDYERFMFDLGTGAEYDVTRWLAVGPALRYGHMVTAGGDVGDQPKFWSLGVQVTLASRPEPRPTAAPPPPAPPPSPEAPTDGDEDGVPDRDDLCPTEPMGDDPDPLRKGCPARDADQDGVPDAEDVCPNMPQGTTPDPARRGCPDGDDDLDGVRNQLDQCPTQPAGLSPDPERPGCPAPDRDGDAVPDLYDACPDKPGAPSTDPKRNGCPGLVRIEADHIKILKPVFFATNKDVILKKSFPVLLAIADALKAVPDIRKVSVEGHTDNRGDDAFNLELSDRRAASVVRQLISFGVEAERLEGRGYGETRPIMPNRTAKGRATNRRVDFVITDPPLGGPLVTP